MNEQASGHSVKIIWWVVFIFSVLVLIAPFIDYGKPFTDFIWYITG